MSGGTVSQLPSAGAGTTILGGSMTAIGLSHGFMVAAMLGIVALCLVFIGLARLELNNRRLRNEGRMD